MDSTPGPAAGSPPAEPRPAPPRPAAPARVLPSLEQIDAWIDGAEVPSLGALFAGLPVAKFDLLVTQLNKAELLPQHWQVISRRGAPEAAAFAQLPEVARLAADTADPALAERRLAALRAGWEELRGKRPALWSVGDLLAALRRLLERRREVDPGDLLAAERDIWRRLALPHGRTQLGLLGPCLRLVREKTK